MKRAKIISAISLMILCICLLSVGIVSTNSNQSMGVGGVINVPQNKIGVVVKGYIVQGKVDEVDYSSNTTADFDSSLTEESGNVESNKDVNGEYITCFGETWQFTQKQLEKMTFDFSNANTDADLENVKVTIMFVITDTSEGNIDLDVYFSKLIEDKQTKVATDVLTEVVEKEVDGSTQTENINTVNVELDESTVTTVEIDGKKIREAKVGIQFTPARYLDKGLKLDFNYTLNVVESKVASGS